MVENLQQLERIKLEKHYYSLKEVIDILIER